MNPSIRPLTACLAWLLLVAVFLLALDRTLFAFWQTRAANDSYLGRAVEKIALADTLAQQAAPKHPRVAILGSSKADVSVSAVAMEQAASALGQPLAVANLGLPGASPYNSLRLLDAIDPQRDRFAAVIWVMLDNQGFYPFSNAPIQNRHIGMLAPVLGFGDWHMLQQFAEPETQQLALSGMLLKSNLLSKDLRDAVDNYGHRRFEVRGYGSLRAWPGMRASLEGLRLEGERVIVPNHYVERLPIAPRIRDRAKPGNLRHDRSRFQRAIMDGWIERYGVTQTQLILVRHPWQPLPNPERYADVELAVQPNPQHPSITYIDDEFDHLLQPKYWADAEHLNIEGRAIYSEILARLAVDALN